MNNAVDTLENRSTYRNIAMSRTQGGGGRLVMSTFGDVVAFAELMARSQHAIPEHLRNNPGACMAVTLLAMRLEFDPFALASKSYVTKAGGTIAYEAQLIAAIVNARAPIKRNPDYAFEGTGDALKCTITAEMNDGSTKTYTSPLLGRIPVKNSPLWKGDPEQQIGYYSIRAWARRHCPDVILGLYTPDEMNGSPGLADRARDVTPPKKLDDRLDALATMPSRETDAPAPHDLETGEDADQTSADAALDPQATATKPPEDPKPDPAKIALLERLRAAAAKGANALRRAKSTTSEADIALLTEADHDALDAAAEAADRAKEPAGAT